jgi:hypothetical protein
MYRVALSLYSFILLSFSPADIRAGGDPAAGSVCFQPLLERTSSGVDSMYIRWRDQVNADPQGYELEWVPAGTAPSGIPDTLLPGGTFEFTLKGVASGTSLWFFIRAVCPLDERSDWNGPYMVTTALLNPSRCGMGLEMQQENCDIPQVFRVEVSGYPNAQLGNSHFLAGVEMIITHTWPEDLTLWLVSPGGKRVVLSNKQGRITDHFGDPGDSTCTAVTRLDPFSCENLAAHAPPYIGTYAPDGDLLDFLDGGQINGTWRLEVCDDLPTDIGFLQYFALDFQPIQCLPVLVNGVDMVTDTSAIVQWEPIRGACDTVYLEYGVAGFTPGSGQMLRLPCTPGEYFINNLLPGTVYDLYIRQKCDTLLSQESCPMQWETACASVSLDDHFDDQVNCAQDCGSQCDLTGNWQNIAGDDMDWLVHSGSTATTRTGPGADVSGNGKYIYIETSGTDCQQGREAILTSTCLLFQGDVVGCQFSFYYHMFGRDMGSLRLEVSLDDGQSWQELWSQSGDKGDQWTQAFIDLGSYMGRIGKLRFVGTGGNGQRGDIALDELRFYGTTMPEADQLVFYRDADGDGYGDSAQPASFCTQNAPAGYVRDSTDCDDTDPLINPGASEIPCNLIDENCNGMEDDRQNNTLDLQLIDKMDASCQAAEDGFIRLMASGGTAPYNYDWVGSEKDSSFIDSLSAGFYQAIVTDSAGCRTEGPYIEIAEHVVLEYAITRLQRPDCPGMPNGEIDIQVAGGMGPYRFEWSNGDTTKNLKQAVAGTYRVAISDSSGCMIVSNDIQLEAAAPMSINLFKRRHPSCNEGMDGSLEIRVNGGTAPYRYSWNTGDTTRLINGLTAGSYSATVTGVNGCEVMSQTYELVDPNSLVVENNGLDMASCPGNDDGAVKIRVSGGTPPYYYNWSNGSFQPDQFRIGAGNYSVTVTDNNGCQIIGGPYTVSEPQQLAISVDSFRPVSCPTSKDGHIAIGLAGGTPPYNYYWSNGVRDTTVLSQLDPGSYNVTITDDFGCKYVSEDFDVYLANIPLKMEHVTPRRLKCHGDANGELVVRVIPGESPYRFNWSTGRENTVSGTSDTLKGLSAGTYRVTVTDNKGCVGFSEDVRIQQPAALTHILSERADPVCAKDSNGVLAITINGGTIPYQYNWTNGDVASRATGLKAGSYRVTVTDANNCRFVSPLFRLEDPSPLGLWADITGSGAGSNSGIIRLRPFGGRSPYSAQWDPRITNITGLQADELAPGTYVVTLIDSGRCELDTSLVVPVIQSAFDLGSVLTDLRLFPVPANDILTLNLSSNDILCWKLDVYNSLGVHVRNWGKIPCLKNWTKSWDVGELETGIYYLVFTNGAFEQAGIRFSIIR